MTGSNAPPTTTAPHGAPLQQVESGMREAEADQRGGGQYAEDGSSAQDLRKEDRGMKAGEPMPR